MSDILIVDSGMRHLGGHNYSYTKAIADVFEKRAFTVDVLTHKYIDPELVRRHRFHPTFTSGRYDFAPGNGRIRDLLYVYAQSVTFADELQAAIRSMNPQLIISHTLADFELIGWSRFVARTRYAGRLALLMRTTPAFAKQRRAKLLLHPYWRIQPHHLNALRRRMGDRFLLTTDSELVTEDFRAIFRGPVVTLPIPVGDHILAGAPAARTPGALRVGYMGDARGLKGFDLLPELARRLLQNAASWRLIVHCPPAASGGNDAQEDPAVGELKALADGSGDRLTLVRDRLSEEGYAALLQQLDVVLIPYRRQTYAFGTSAIFAEAMALGKPVVVPSGTWMSHELAKYGGGVEFESGNASDLAGKVMSLVRDFASYAQQSTDGAAAWRDFHNPRKLVDLVLQHSGLASARTPAISTLERVASNG